MKIPVISEPPPGATLAELKKAGRKHWSQTGRWPDWYFARKKELDKEGKT